MKLHHFPAKGRNKGIFQEKAKIPIRSLFCSKNTIIALVIIIGQKSKLMLFLTIEYYDADA
jgi:hypothetical protein